MPVWTSLIPNHGKTRRSDGWLASRSRRESGAVGNAKNSFTHYTINIFKGCVIHNKLYRVNSATNNDCTPDCIIKRTYRKIWPRLIYLGQFGKVPPRFGAFTCSAYMY